MPATAAFPNVDHRMSFFFFFFIQLLITSRCCPGDVLLSKVTCDTNPDGWLSIEPRNVSVRSIARDNSLYNEPRDKTVFFGVNYCHQTTRARGDVYLPVDFFARYNPDILICTQSVYKSHILRSCNCSIHRKPRWSTFPHDITVRS